jgi:DNA polymerase-1
MRNTTVQGAAAIVFKDAGNRLRLRLRQLGARIILPMHDAFVFEAPLERVEEAAALAEEVLKGAVQEWFPMLVPQVDVNIKSPLCWNKGGKADSIRRWLSERS